MKLLELSIPEYQVTSPPDVKKIGGILDNLLIKNFSGKSILIRGIASSEHPDLTIDRLIEIIKESGTDRYDPERSGDRYENIENKQIDLFAFPAIVTKTLSICEHLIYGFYHSAIGIHGRPMRIDIIMIYDADQMDKVSHKYKGQDHIKEDGFVFIDQNNKQNSLLGIIKVL